MMIGKTISHYKILEQIGAGGMGVVYKAQDTKLDRFVALKFLPPYLGEDEEKKKRFVQEAKAASALDHPNICTIYEINETDAGQMFIAMAYYEGEILKLSIVNRQLSIDNAIDIAIQIAEGLDRAHRKGIVHRDIKPANIIVTEEGRVKILDFGLAKMGDVKLTRTDSTLGTIVYMSPEQVRGEAVDQRADIWSLGVILYEMLSGQLPFSGDHDHAVMYAIINREPAPLERHCPELPPALIHIVNCALEKDPGDRYQSMQEMLADLYAQRGEAFPKTSLDRIAAATETFRKRQNHFYSVLSFIFLLLLAAGIYFLHLPGRISPENISPEPQRIAVLPLVNLSPDQAEEFLVDGMTEELISTLSRIGNLRVIARTSIIRYKSSNKNVAEIGRELNVNVVLEGSIRKANNMLRVAVQLIKVEDQSHIWAEVYDREMQDMLTIQSDLAREVATALSVELLAGEKELIEKQQNNHNQAAFTLYLKGLIN